MGEIRICSPKAGGRLVFGKCALKEYESGALRGPNTCKGVTNSQGICDSCPISQDRDLCRPNGGYRIPGWTSQVSGGPLVTGLPFAVGETWDFTQNFHGGVNAMGFQTITGKPGRVRAADDGTVVWEKETCVLIRRADGMDLGYQHVEPSDIAELKPVMA